MPREYHDDEYPNTPEFITCRGCGKKVKVFWWNYHERLQMALCTSDNCSYWHVPVNPDKLISESERG